MLPWLMAQSSLVIAETLTGFGYLPDGGLPQSAIASSLTSYARVAVGKSQSGQRLQVILAISTLWQQVHRM